MGKERLCELGFNLPKDGKVMAQQTIMLKRAEKELPSASDLAKVDDIEIQEIIKNVARSMENLIEQLEKMLPMHKLKGLDKQLRSIRGSLKAEVVKKIELQQCIENEKLKLEEVQENPEYDDGIQEDTRK